jgi:site-specific recombinase XerC
LRAHTAKPLNQISVGDLISFTQSLSEAGLAPISRARTLAAVKSLFGFCRRMSHIESNPAIALPLPRYESQLAERMIGESDVGRLLSVETSLRDRALVPLPTTLEFLSTRRTRRAHLYCVGVNEIVLAWPSSRGETFEVTKIAYRIRGM